MTGIAQQNTDEKKDRLIAAGITLGIGGLILLVLIFWVIVTPIPPFPEIAGNEGQEINFGIYNAGTGNIEGPGIGEATSVVAESKPTPTEEAATKEEDFKNGEQVLESNDNKPKVKENTTVITPVKPTKDPKKEDDKSASNLLNAYTKNKNNSQSGGDGNSGHAGNEGSPDGNPNTDGKGGKGNEDGDGTVPGKDGIGGIGGRKVVVYPPRVSDSHEEGIVVVYITIDKNGNVIDAVEGKGTNTSSATLKSKARQSAKMAKFSPSNKEIQKTTITYFFSF